MRPRQTEPVQYISVSPEERDIELVSLDAPSFIPPSIIKDNGSELQRSELVIHWNINWRTPLTMVSLLLGGGAVASGHHIFYQSLNGTSVDSNDHIWSMSTQEWNVRYGTALAFVTKTCLAAAVSLAYRQQIWISLRNKYFKISAINAMFEAVNDPFAFLDLDFVWESRLGATLALMTWYVGRSLALVLVTEFFNHQSICPFHCH